MIYYFKYRSLFFFIILHSIRFLARCKKRSNTVSFKDAASGPFLTKKAGIM